MQYSIQKEFVDIFQALEHFSIYNMWCYVVWYSFYEFSTKMKLLSLSLSLSLSRIINALGRCFPTAGPRPSTGPREVLLEFVILFF